MLRERLSEDEIKSLSRRMRLHAMDMALAAGSRGAHVSGSLSCIEIYAVLYGSILNYDTSNPLWNDRDRFIAGKEHARLAEYPARAEILLCPYASHSLPIISRHRTSLQHWKNGSEQSSTGRRRRSAARLPVRLPSGRWRSCSAKSTR